MSEVEIHVEWITEGKLCMGTLRFGCVYENESGIAYPWRNNGAWKLYPRDVRVLHMTDSKMNIMLHCCIENVLYI